MLMLIFQGSIVYAASGYYSAPAYFDIDSTTGSIFVRENLNTDIATTYVVS